MNRLKELRSTIGLSQAQLAELAETTQRNISYWESGRVEMNLNTAIKLAHILNVEVEYLAGISDDLGIFPEMTLSPMGENMTTEERKLVEQYRQLPEQLKKLVRQQLDIYTTPSELLPKNTKKV